MKKFIAFVMALALLCMSMFAVAASAEQETPETAPIVEEVSVAEEEPVAAQAETPCQHTPDGEGTVVKEPTCTEAGLTQYTCSVCGKKYTVSEPDALGHAPEGEAIDSKAPTCTEEGWQEFNCANGAHTFKVTLPKAQHELEELKHTDATCTEPETTIYKCKNCDYTETLYGEDALGHRYTNDHPDEVGEDDLTIHVEYPATCTDEGLIADYYYCLRCGHYSDETANTIEWLPVLEHEWLTDETEDNEYFVYEQQDDESMLCTGGKLENGENADKFVEDSMQPDLGEIIHYEVLNPTCTEDGYVRVTCTLCGATKTEVLKATGHVWEEVIAERTPECVTNGSRVYECSVCHDRYQEIIKCRGYHNFDEDIDGHVIYFQKNFYDTGLVEVDEPAKCNAYIKRVLCDNYEYGCDAYNDIEVAATEEHVEGATIQYQAPSCTEAGHKLYQCANCGYPIWEDIEATGHNWDNGTITKPATCTEDGVKTYKCTNPGCKETKTEAIPTAGHTKIQILEKEPNCTEEGYYEERCLACGETIVPRIILPIKHSYEGAQILHRVDATCEKDGEISYYCSLCHKLVEREVLPATGHDWGEEEDAVIVPPTCEHVGTITRTCLNCNKTDVEEFGELQPHTLDVEEGSVVVQYTLPTCTEEGLNYYTCSVCGKMDTMVVPALGHNYYNEDGELNIIWDEETSTWVLVCVRCGEPLSIEVHDPSYEIGVNAAGTRGTITLNPDCKPIAQPYVRITWRYTLENGDTVSFTTCRFVAMDDDAKTGTFKLTGLSAPSGSHCDFIYVEVVEDPDADELDVGEYDTFGKKSL